jgi:predicted nucleic acid-binding protein
MRYILDTTILIIYIRDKELRNQIEEKYNLFSSPNIPIVSVVSAGELYSMAKQNKWGKQKISAIETLLKEVVIIDLHFAPLIELYAQIDAYSQGKLENMPLNDSARNMGKNDLWIAATSAMTKAKLLTTDDDFDHLDKVFIDVDKVGITIM